MIFFSLSVIGTKELASKKVVLLRSKDMIDTNVFAEMCPMLIALS